ncbi:MAG: hypothetical protein ABGZ17_32020 [Planctomycetaceae bacterium]
MSHKKPQPLITSRTPDPCPVCGEISYSRAGVHPQCAVLQADAKRLKHSKRVVDKPKTSKTEPWQKICPQCKTVQHVRKQICTCGHTFAIRSRP